MEGNIYSRKMHRALTRCTACRYSVLDTFASLAGISISSAPAASRQGQRFAQPLLQQAAARLLSQSSPSRQQLPPSERQPPSAPELSQPSGPDSSSIPWYLQVEEPTPPAPISPILALQEIPPLPSDPPIILQSVLEHLSIQIGLDNLVLLDLRGIDPPPALGANLLMIIGTARSVKHLNVSADRFCRWARKEYKLRPYADGLLGRNELKLKLRRKARRMKLARSVGNTVAMQNPDDGITTGWICVNMGPVDEAVMPLDDSERDPSEDLVEDEDEEDEYTNQEEDDYVGFGSRINSPRIVVQMFTEEKRLEMDLEGLWDVRNTRRAQREQRAGAKAKSAVERLGEKEESADGVPSTRMEDEVDSPKGRQGMAQSQPLGSMGGS